MDGVYFLSLPRSVVLLVHYDQLDFNLHTNISQACLGGMIFGMDTGSEFGSFTSVFSP
jgi:hypothetical protein